MFKEGPFKTSNPFTKYFRSTPTPSSPLPPSDYQWERARSPFPLTIPLNISTLNSLPNFYSTILRCSLTYCNHKRCDMRTNVQNKDKPYIQKKKKKDISFQVLTRLGVFLQSFFLFHLQKNPTMGALCSFVIFYPTLFQIIPHISFV